MKSNKLDLVAIVGKNECYIAKRERLNDGYSSNLTHFYFDGEQKKEAFVKSWVITNSVPEKIQTKKSGQNVNYRYELIDPSMESDKIPFRLEKDECTVDDDYETYWLADYKHLRSLYELKYDTTEPTFEDVEFDIEIVLELDHDLKESFLKFKGIGKSGWSTKEYQPKVKTQLLDKLLFPNIYVQSERPVMLSSDDLYAIIRNHVKNNIDKTKAEITSDYNFCFTVKKLVWLSEPQYIQTEITKNNGCSYAKPRYKTSVKKYDCKYEIFEMTDKSNKYKGYPVLPDLYADNMDELNEKLDVILTNLMEYINSEVKLCPTCKGIGIIDTHIEKVNVNRLINGGEING